MNCRYCSQEFVAKDYRQKFCNRSCAASFNNTGRVRTEDSKEKMRAYMKLQDHAFGKDPEADRLRREKGLQKIRKPVQRIQCNNCSKIFEERSGRYRRYCSPECRKPHLGGYRQGAGRSKSGWYNGIWCDSTYELAFVAYHLDKGSDIKRNEESWPYTDEAGHTRRYFPDFVVDGLLYEIKGFMSERDMLKPENVDVVLINGPEENGPFIQYLMKTKNIVRGKLHTLYDDAPTYNHVCANCTASFVAHEIKRTYCSQKCAGKNRALPGYKKKKGGPP